MSLIKNPLRTRKFGRNIIPGDRIVLAHPDGQHRWTGQITHFSQPSRLFGRNLPGTRIAWAGHVCLGPVLAGRLYEMERPKPVFSTANTPLAEAA